MSQRVLTEAERRETVTETMARWALEGGHPTQRDLDEIRAYVAGDIDEEDLIARQGRLRCPTGSPTRTSSQGHGF